MDTNEEASAAPTSPAMSPRPPPIFIYDVINYPRMINHFAEVAEEETYSTKSMANNIIKINCNTPDTYRKLISFMKDRNIVYHSYQPKEDRSYRVVIRHLHHTVDTQDIANELAELGHKVRNILNAKHRQTKEPLNLFFVDLEPAANNKDIFHIKSLQNKIIEIEPPNKPRHIIQCTRCQLYGHSKSYCNRPYMCVKCGGPHNSTTCAKSKDTPARCGLCEGTHPANYKGCPHYHNLIKNKKPIRTQQDVYRFNTTPATPIAREPTATKDNIFPVASRSYAAVTRDGQTGNHEAMLCSMFEEFKQIIYQLTQQNSQILNMLTMLLNKLSP
jgi:hypothetical protein